MTTAAAPMVLQLLLSRGVPQPLAALVGGSCAALSDDHQIAVYDCPAVPAWTLTAAARWPESVMLDAHPWVALAPHENGLLLLNMATCDISGLPAGVRMSLDMQHQRYAPVVRPASGLTPRFRVATDGAALHVSAPSGGSRVLPIGAPFTVTAEAYARHQEMTFAYLSPGLRMVARAIADFGPIGTTDLLHRLYPTPVPGNRDALKVTLSRLRHHPRISLTRLSDGRLTISAIPAALG